MKQINYLRYAPAIIFCLGSVIGWLLGKDGSGGVAYLGVACFVFATWSDK
jgi:hypothetical protein